MIKREPAFVFDNLLSLGIDYVPNNSIVTILDYNGESKQVIKVGDFGLTPTSTIQDFLLDDSLWSKIIENVNGGIF